MVLDIISPIEIIGRGKYRGTGGGSIDAWINTIDSDGRFISNGESNEWWWFFVAMIAVVVDDSRHPSGSSTFVSPNFVYARSGSGTSIRERQERWRTSQSISVS